MATAILNTNKFLGGRFGTSFHSVATEASVTHLFEFSTAVGGDNTNAKFSCYVDYLQMSCNSAGRPHIKDGSSGGSLVGSQPPAVDTTDAPGSQSYSQAWDWRDDPLVCLTADGTSVLSIDMTVAGAYTGFVKYHFGPPPTA